MSPAAAGRSASGHSADGLLRAPLARVVAVSAVALGAAMLVASLTGLVWPAPASPAGHAMLRESAIAVVALGGALWLRLSNELWRRRGAQALALGVLVGSLAALVASWAGRIPVPWVHLEVRFAGQPSPWLLALFAALALALALADCERSAGRRVCNGLVWIAFLGTYAVLTCWLFDASLSHRQLAAAVGPQTVLALTLLAGGIALVRPERPPLCWLLESSLRGVVARRLLPAVIAGPVLVGLPAFLGEQLGWYERPTTGALVALVTSLLLGVAVNMVAARIGRLERAVQSGNAVIASSHDAIIVKSLDWTIRSWNPAAERLYGFSASEVIGTSFGPLVPSHCLQDEHAIFERLRNGERVGHYETQRIRKDGRTVDVSLTVSPIHDETGRLTAAATIARDISERKRADAELAHLAAIVEHSEDAIFSTTLDGTILTWNASAERLYGYSAGEAAGRDVALLIPADRVGERDQILADVATGRAVEPFETQRLTKTGTRVEVSINVSPLRDGAGRVVAASAIARDVTRRKRAELALAASERRYRTMVSNLPGTVVFVFDEDLRFVLAEGDGSVFPFPLQTLPGRVLQEAVPSDRAAAVEPLYRAALAGHAQEAELETPDGRSLWTRVVPVRDDTGRVSVAMSLSVDVTARKQAEETFRRLFEEAPIGVARVDLDGAFVDVNPALCRLIGRSRHELQQMSWQDIMHPDDAAASQQAMTALEREHHALSEGERRFLHARGEPVWVSITSTLLRDADGQPEAVLAQVQDITERRRYERDLQRLADHDSLTGLFNRRRFDTELERHLLHVKRYGEAGAVIMVDLDHFKYVNDTLGHAAGDQVIKKAARVLHDRLRASDVVARLGGDEFAVIVPKADAQEAQVVAQAIVEGIRDTTCLLKGKRHRITASVGVAPIKVGQSAEDVIISADLALYKAKEAGRDRYACDANGREHLKARMSQVEQIRQALEDDRLVLHAQPIYDLRRDEITRYELLARIRDDHGELVPPAAWLDVAERFDLIQAVDRRVVERAIALLATHHAMGDLVSFEVNLSGKSIGNFDLLEVVRRELSARPALDPSRLVFEITETTAVANIPQAQAFADQLAELGCRFALDDFGSGFASFYYLKHLPFDYVKIDGEFVNHAAANRTDQLVIEALVAIARGMNKKTIAEYVEDRETLEYLRAIGVDYAQGHFIGRAQPPRLLARDAAAGPLPMRGPLPRRLGVS